MKAASLMLVLLVAAGCSAEAKRGLARFGVGMAEGTGPAPPLSTYESGGVVRCREVCRETLYGTVRCETRCW